MRTKRVPSVVSVCGIRLGSAWPTLIVAVFLLASLSSAAAEIGQERGFSPNQVYQIGEIDSVNVSNGDVIVRIPIGHEYSVGPTLRYQFTLTYNSKVWEYGFGALPGAPMEDQRYAYPEKRSNAGFGWIFSLGRLAIDFNHNSGVAEGWTYIAPDGAEFRFNFSMSLNDVPDQTVLYAYSGRYLRLRRLASSYEIDFPDGEVHTFDSLGNLIRMRDPFGNWVKIEIANHRWTVTDGYGTETARTHYVDFQDVSALYPFPAYSENFGTRVVAVDLEAFGGARAEYGFTYKDNASVGYGGFGTGNPPPCVKGPLLTTVLLPDGSSYAAAYNEVPAENCGYYVLNDGSGTIRSLDLPTGGSIAWTHGSYEMPLKECYSPVVGYSNGVDGVTSRTFSDGDGDVVSKWTYSQRLLLPYFQVSGKICGSDTVVQVPNAPREQYVNIVEAPGGLVTKHYFSAWSEDTLYGNPSPNGFIGDELGLPISHSRERDGHFLSTEVFDCSNGCARDQWGTVTLTDRLPVRRTYLRYRRHHLFHDGAPWPTLIDESRPHMVESQLAETEIDPASGVGARFTKTTYSDFDGYGHFGTTVTVSNFPGVQTRTSTVTRQHNVSIGAWLLDMYGDSVVQEGALTTRTKTEFDWITGFRKSTRTLADPAMEQGKDLMTVWCRDTDVTSGQRGFVTSERTVGGDRTPIPAGDICAATSPSVGHYFLDHSYAFTGARLVRHTAQWAGTSFLSSDRDYDPSSGLVETTRDSSGVPTSYNYDLLGRLKEVRPDQQAWTRYRYDRTSRPNSVHVDVWPNGSTAPVGSSDGALNDQHYYYDDFGRLVLAKSRMPGNNVWVAARTTYDSSGRVAAAFIPVETDNPHYELVTPLYSTTSTYDIFGRTTKGVSPDGSEVHFSYAEDGSYPGDRIKTRTQKIWNGQSEIPAPTTEEYDGFGRVVNVTERSHSSGTDVTTEYEYAAGGRLSSVRINGIQPRTFEYDGRGFLLRETHPESGLTSYTYDARGNVVSKTAAQPSFNLHYDYDSAGRLITVSGSSDPLKEFEYGDDNGPDDWRKGKLIKATRYNYPATSPTLNTRQDTIRVIETYAYRRLNGRQTDRRTEISSGDHLLASFTQSEHYDQLDLPDVVTYPKCVLCGLPPRDSVTTHYQYGRVDRVDEAIESTTYAPTGAWLERKHTNQIVDVQTPDPHGMARPEAIGVSLPASCTAIASQPEDVSITAGGNATLTVTAVASDATYQWYRGARGDTRGILSNEVTSVLHLQGVTATTSYWCRVTAGGCAEASRTVTVDTCRLILTEPQSVRLNHGQSTTLSLTTQHADATFQWYKGLRGDTSAPIAGATSNVLPLTAATATESYWCRVRRVDPNDPSNVCTQDSQTATVTVCAPFEIVNDGIAGLSTVAIDVPLTFSVQTSGEHLSYAWYRRRASEPIGARVQIGSGMQVQFTPTTETTVEDPLLISVEVTNGCASEVRTIAQLIVVTLPPCRVNMELEPYAIEQLISNEAAILKARMSVAPAANIDIYTDIKYRFRWYQYDSLQQDHLSEGEPEGAAQHEETATSNYYLRSFEHQAFVRLDATVLCSTGSATVTSPVSSHRSFVFYYGHCPVPDVVSDPPAAVLRNVLSIQLTADSIYPRATFQWYKGESGNTASEVSQGDGQTITVTQPGTYWVRAFSDCAHADSPTVTVSEETNETICTPVRIVGDPEDQAIAAFQPITLSVAATANPQPDSFVWRTVPGPNVASGAATVTIDPGPRLTTDYSVEVGNDCSLVDSRPARVHVTSCADMTIQVQPPDLSVAEGDTASLTITATSVAPLRYQWYAGESGDTSSPIGGLNPTDPNYDPARHGPTLDLGTPTTSQRYWVRLSFDDKTKCEVDSRTSTVSVCAAPRITGPPHDRTSIVPGVDQIFEVQAEGEGLSYAWYEGPENDESKLLSTAVALIVYPRKTTDYWVKVTSDCAPPHADRSAKAAFKVSVCPLFPGDGMPTATKTLVTSGTTTTLTVDVDRGDMIEWYKIVGAGAPVKFAEGPGLATVTTPVITEQTAFFARAISGACSRDSERIVIEICTDPTIHWLASSPRQVSKGETFFLSVGLGVGQTANMQWYRGTVSGDVANSTPLCGASNACQIHSLQATTSYWVRAVDETTGCYADTAVRTVNVCIPTIVTQPQSVMINSGASTTLGVTTDDLPGATYQWYTGQRGDTSNPLPGKTANTLTVTPSATTTYWVRVTGCPSPLDPVSRDSEAATVTICQPPAITTDLQARVVPRNYNLTLSVVATGDGLHYQWYKGAAGDVTTPVGTDSNSYSFTTTVSTQYWVRVTGTCGGVNSAAPPISVEPGITTHPAGGLVVSGATRTLTVVATGADLTYSWYQRNGSTSTLIAGATGPSYTTPPITADVTYYSRVCSGGACTNSNDAVFEVCTDPTIHWSYGNEKQVTKGETFFLSVGLGPGETANMQWYRGTVSGDVSNSTLMCGSTNTCQINSLQATTSYWVRALSPTSTCYDDTAVHTVNVCIPTIVTQPQSVTINAGASTTLTVTTDNLPGVSYQWYTGQPGVTTNPLAGATSNSLSVTPSATTTYWVRVTGCSGAGLTPVTRDSAAATVTICQPPQISQQPQSQGASGSRTFSVTATGTELTYQWYEGASGVVTKPIAGATNASVTVNPTYTTKYWVRVNGRCGSVNSASATLARVPVIQTEPDNSKSVTKGTSTQLSVVALGNELTYQWFQRTATGSLAITGQTTATLTTPPIDADTTFFCRVWSGSTTTAILSKDSADATVKICLPNTFTATKYGEESQSKVNLAIDAPISGETFQWYSGVSGDLSNSSLVGTGLYVTVYPAETTAYWVRTTRSGCHADSPAKTVNVCRPKITSAPPSVTIPKGSSKILTVSATGTGPLYYQWYKNDSNVIGANAATYDTGPLDATATYRVRVTASSSCSTRWTDSPVATITVCQPPVIAEQPGPEKLWPYNHPGFSLGVTATGDDLHYQWYEGAVGNTSKPVGTDSNQYAFTPTATKYYWVRISGSCGPAISSQAVRVSVYPKVNVPPADTSVCGVGGTATFTVTAANPADVATYQWYRKVSGQAAELVGGNSSTLQIAVNQVPVEFWVTLTSGLAKTTSERASVATINPVPTVTSFTAPPYGSYRFQLTTVVPSSQASLVKYMYYQGPLGDTTTLLGDSSLSTKVVTPPYRPITYWVRVYYTDTGCATDRAVTIP